MGQVVFSQQESVIFHSLEVQGKLFSQSPIRSRSSHWRNSPLKPILSAIWNVEKWLSHRDCCQLFARCIDAESVGYAIVYGTSNNPRQIWSLATARRLLKYEPQDARRGPLVRTRFCAPTGRKKYRLMHASRPAYRARHSELEPYFQ